MFLQIMVFQHKKADNNIKNLKIIQSQISSLLCNTVLRKIAETFHKCFDDSLWIFVDCFTPKYCNLQRATACHRKTYVINRVQFH